MSENYMVDRLFVAAGNNLGGGAPTVDPEEVAEDKPWLREYLEAEDGGRFVFDRLRGGCQLKRLRANFGDATSWAVNLRVKHANGVSDALVVDSDDLGTNEVLLTGSSILQIAPGDELIITTSGATTAMEVEVFAERW